MPIASAAAAVAPFARALARPQDEVAFDLETFATLLARWQAVQNLVSRETLPELWSRHVADSLQLLPMLRPHDRTILDLGSGGGFPALPLAIALKGREVHFHLVEPTGRKASFLRTAVRELGLSATVHQARADAVAPAALGAVDVITSRALAPLPELLRMAFPFWNAQTLGLFHKGRDHPEELAKSQALWHYDSTVFTSAVESDGVVLRVSSLAPRRP